VKCQLYEQRDLIHRPGIKSASQKKLLKNKTSYLVRQQSSQNLNPQRSLDRLEMKEMRGRSL
jgi:hypothetical protein